MENEISAVILAAGKGTRMNSDMPKVMHKLCGLSLIMHAVLNVRQAGIKNIAVVTGYEHQQVEDHLGNSVVYCHQDEQLGTGHAVKCASKFISENKGKTLILCGDAPMQSAKVIRQFTTLANDNSVDMAVLTANLEQPANYGRIFVEDGKLKKIIEKKDCTPEQLNIKEINSGTYIVDSEKLLEALDNLSNDNAQNEYYLTDTVEYFYNNDYNIISVSSKDPTIVMGVNDLIDLNACEQIMRAGINKKLMGEGVRIIDPNTTYIDRTVTVGRGTTIYPNTIITGKTTIGENNTIYSSRIDTSKIGNNNIIDNSTLELTILGDNNKIGTYAKLNQKTKVFNNSTIGNFAQTSNCIIGSNTSIEHSASIGDAQVGDNVNIGYGVAIANYDGKKYNTSLIKDGSFIGCNSTLIAPVSIGENTYVAAGTTITTDTEDNSFIIGRVKPSALKKV